MVKHKIGWFIVVVFLIIFVWLGQKFNLFTPLRESGLTPKQYISESFSQTRIPIFKNYFGVYFEDKLIGGLDPFTIEAVSLDYLKDKNGVYYFEFTGPVDSRKIIIKPLPGADPASFETVNDFAKDKNHIYRQDKIIEGPDAATFMFLNRSFYRDQNMLYVAKGSYGPNKDLIPTSRDINTFHLLPVLSGEQNWLYWQSGYSVDQYGVYYDPEQFYEGMLIPGADPLTFHVLMNDPAVRQYDPLDIDYNYAADKDRVYFEGKTVVSANPSTFEVIDNGSKISSYLYGKDQSGVYYRGKLLIGADPRTFKILWRSFYEGCGPAPYSRDSSHLYYEADLVPGADLDTFQVFTHDYGTDKNHVYLKGVVQPGINPATFVEPVCNYG